MPPQIKLPIDSHLPKITSLLKSHKGLILRADPGAGKTTRVPLALAKVTSKTVLVLEPRRLAARLSAVQMASGLNEKAGEFVGYQMRFERAVSEKTKIKFITEGIFERLLQKDPLLRDVGIVVIDEFHERHIQTDIALAATRHLIKSQKRDDLKLVVMSATLDTKELEAFLELPTLKVEGRAFPVTTHFLGEISLLSAVEKMLQEETAKGDILVFMTGLSAMRSAQKELAILSKKHPLEILLLSAEVPKNEQKKVFEPSSKRKVILATNVAETSITLPNVTGVIDLGKAKIASLAPWSGLTSIDIKRVPQSSCEQRTGRAGRVQAGVCYRLFDRADFLTRNPYLAPEIMRLDITSPMLSLKILEKKFALDGPLELLSPPLESLLESARRCLFIIKALDSRGDLTEKGEKIARLPIHPRLAAVVVEGVAIGIAREALLMASLVSEGGILKSRVYGTEGGECDLVYQIALLEEFYGGDIDPYREKLIDKAKLASCIKLAKSLSSHLKVSFSERGDIKKIGEQKIAKALLAGFSDRVAVARQQKKGKHKKPVRAYNLCRGRGGVLSDSSVVQKSPFVLALLAEESQNKKNAAVGTSIHMASGIKPLYLMEYPSPIKKTVKTLIFDEKKEAIVKCTQVSYDQVVVGERYGALDKEDLLEAKELLIENVKKRWPLDFPDKEALKIYHNKLEVQKKQNIPVELPYFEGEMLDLLQESIFAGETSFANTLKISLKEHLRGVLGEKELYDLDSLTPDSIKLPSQKTFKITYEEGRTPYISGRMQDFYGIKEHPTICNGLALVVHLLAPSMRPIQVTDNLKTFFSGSYKRVRQEMKQRYPKHDWPEDPLLAKPRAFSIRKKARGHLGAAIKGKNNSSWRS